MVGCSPWGRKESDTTEPLHFHFSLSCIGEGNGNPLQCSCLENPRDGGAWWAAIYGVAQSRTRLKRLSSSSSSSMSSSKFIELTQILIIVLEDKILYLLSITLVMSFPDGSDSKESACNAGDLDLIPGSGRSPGEGNGNLLQ